MDDTEPQKFFKTPDQTIEVEMMHMTSGEFNYAATPEFQILGIPYKGPDLNLFVFLPREKNALAKELVALDGKTLIKMMEKTSSGNAVIVKHFFLVKIRSPAKLFRSVQVSLPKFIVEDSIEMTPILQKLGIDQLFSDRANLTKITTDEQLGVSNVIHKSFIEVTGEIAWT